MERVTEKTVKDRVKRIIMIYMKYNNIYTFCPMTFGYGESGHPDRVVLINGVYIGIETKRDRNNHHSRPELKPKPNEVMQKRQARSIMAAGGEWICVHNDNLNELNQLLARYASAPPSTFSAEDYEALQKVVG